MPARRARARASDRDVAIVGMAGRFPGAAGPDELWPNITAGIESITFFTDEELLAAGIDPALVEDPDYVKAKGILGGVDLFDAAFFGLNPREVELMDPQHRIFLECCWEALERAGYDADRYPGSIGVYGGESMNTYLLTNLLPHMEMVASVDTLQASLGNDKDPLTSRVAYKLGLKGPSITIQSASSTSLVSIHVACQSLRQGNCDMALAGGVSIHLPEVSGYRFQEGGTTARDGHCRAFDASATGFVSGHGAAVVVLKRLDDALADGDHVHAVIKAAACNNDGAVKVSFMAPSVDGQVDVYERAYAEAGVSPATVGYVECHGTGTALGDPIEFTALDQVFSRAGAERGGTAIGSLKTNIGHLDTAAGACALIKATLTVERGVIPPSLHFERPNPQIDFASSPFFVNTELRPWGGDGTPRRAGVTSLGMGGTNAHVVLEEAPPVPEPAPSRAWQLLLLSAKTESALDAATGRLGVALGESGDGSTGAPARELADVAYTLQVGRKPFAHRRMLLCQGGQEGVDDASRALVARDPQRLLSGYCAGGDRPVAFLFPGQGAQYPGMGRGLYETERLVPRGRRPLRRDPRSPPGARPARPALPGRRRQHERRRRAPADGDHPARPVHHLLGVRPALDALGGAARGPARPLDRRVRGRLPGRRLHPGGRPRRGRRPRRPHAADARRRHARGAAARGGGAGAAGRRGRWQGLARRGQPAPGVGGLRSRRRRSTSSPRGSRRRLRGPIWRVAGSTPPTPSTPG